MTNSTSTRKTTRAAKTTAKKEQFNMQLAHETEIDLSADDALIASMLAGIETDAAAVGAANPEVILAEGNSDAALIDISDDAAIEAAVAEIEKAEAVQEHYAGETHPGDEPIATVAPKAEKKGKKVVAPKPPKAPKAAKEPKPASAPVVRYNGHKTNASDVLKARLGDKAGEMLVLEIEDAALAPAELEAKQSELLALLNRRPGSEGGSTQQKVAEKIVMLFGWLKSGGKLNEVMERTFKVLARDGHITTGEKGNLHAELLSKPYSLGTARAQGGQMQAMLPLLKVVSKADKGKLVANPNSMILLAVRNQLGL